MNEMLGRKVRCNKRWIKSNSNYPRYDIEDIKKWRMLKHPEILTKDESEMFSQEFQHIQCEYRDWLNVSCNKIKIESKWLDGAKKLESEELVEYIHYVLHACNIIGVIVGKRSFPIKSDIILDYDYCYDGSETEHIEVNQHREEYYMVATSMAHISKIPCDCVEFIS